MLEEETLFREKEWRKSSTPKWNKEGKKEITSGQETTKKWKYEDKEEEEKMAGVQARRQREERMIFCNVAGIKGKAEDCWSFIKEFEVIGLTETWLVGKEEAIARRKLEEKYEIELVAASKEIGKGRPKGEIILAMKKGIYQDVPDARRWKGKEFIDREVRRQERKMYVGVTYMRESRKKKEK